MLLNSKYDNGLPIGAVLQGYGLDPLQYLPLDGRVVARSAWSMLEKKFPVGKYTGTQRTIPQTAAGGPLIATANHFVAAGVAGTTAIVYSADGATWANATTPASTTPVAICAMAARIVALQSTAAQPVASATLDPTSVWSATTGGPVSVTVGNHFSRMVYSAALGRMVACAGSSRYTMDDASTAWTLRTGSGAIGNPVGVCWTGNRFLLIAANSAATEISTDGITYAAGALLAEATASAQGNIDSDGAGMVVVSGCASGLQVSHDHGATWAVRQIPGVPASDAWRVRWLGDRFVVPTLLGLAFSKDGDSWFLETTPVQAFVANGGVAKKGAVTVHVPGGSAPGYSFTESATEFLLPNARSFNPAASGNPVPLPGYYIKGA